MKFRVGSTVTLQNWEVNEDTEKVVPTFTTDVVVSTVEVLPSGATVYTVEDYRRRECRLTERELVLNTQLA